MRSQKSKSGYTKISTRVLPLLVVMSLIAASLVTRLAEPAAAVSAFSPTFSTNAPGNITFVSNTLMTCNETAGTNAATCVSNGQNGNAANNNHTMREVDIDSDPTTTNSSSNDLTLASTSNVLYAGLFWVGMASSANNFDPNIKIDTPAAGGYTNLVASNIDNLGSRHYGAYVDVTSLVQAGGNGTYTVGGADLLTGASSRYGGWTLAIAYQDNTEPWRNLTVFNGYDFVYNGNTPTSYNVPLTVSGFTAPPIGPVNATIGVQTGEGDALYAGPTTEVNGTQISDAMNPINNVQNSTISILGTPANTLANPSYPNQLGFDADIMDATGLIPPNATSANLRFRSTGDVYGINLISTAIEIYVPNLTANLEKTGVDLNGEDTHPGDIIEYRVKFDNTGDDPATNVVITDLVPAGTTYVANSLQILQDVGTTGPMTDAAGDDKAFFDATTNSAVFHVGTGANASQGGQVDPVSQGGQTHEVAFQVKVDPGTEFTTVTNKAVVDYTAKFVNEEYSAMTNPVDHEIEPLVDLKIAKSDDIDPVTAGNDITYTVSVKNDGPSPASNVVITDTLPAGLTFVSGAGCSVTGSTLTCAAGNLAAGATYNLDITVTVDGTFTGTSVTNLAEVTSDTHEHDTSNNQTKEPTAVVRSADVKLTKSAPTTVEAGTSFTYTLTVENLGDSDALNVKLFDPIPTGTSFVSATADLGGVCDTTVECLWSSLAAGASSTVTIVVSVPGSTADGTIITNKAEATSTDPDPDTSNNTDAAKTEVEKLADLATTKTGPATAVAGDQVTYTVDVTNNGPSDAVNVVVSDPVPSTGFTLNSTASSSGCTLASGVISCNAGTLTSGGTASFTLVFDIDQTMADGTVVTNTAGASSDTDDPNTDNDKASVETEIVREADLYVQKDDDTALAVAGTQMTYTLSYGNNGDSDGTGISIVDTLPAGVTFNSGLSDASCSAAGQTVTCTVGDVAAGDSGTILVVVDISSSLADGTTLSNKATISGTEDDPNADNNDTKVDTPTERSAELELTKTDNVDPVIAGEDISYTISVTNIGPSTDTGIVLTDSLPTGVTFVSAPGCSEASGIVTCNIGTLAPSATVSFVVTVTAAATLSDGQILTNTASASGDFSESRSVTEQTTVNTEADLELTKSAPSTAVAGTSTTYSLTVTNAGSSNAANISITDALPTGSTYSSHTVTSGSGSCTATASNIACSQATLAPNATFTVDVVVDVAETVANGTTLTNTATTDSDTDDPNPDNNTASAPTEIERSADLGIEKTTISSPVQAGQPASFQIVVTNNGPSQATGVAISDTLPTGFTFNVGASSSGCVSGVTCSVPTALNTGDTYTFTIVADVDSNVSDGTYTNNASVSGNESDPNTGNDNGEDEVEIVTNADLSIVKTSDDETFTPGTTESYSVVVSNGGPSDAQNVVVTDVLPTGLTFNSGASSSQCSTGVSCVLTTLGANQSVTLTIAVDVDSSLTGSITNKVEIASDTNDPDPSNNSDDDPTPLVPEADLAVEKSAAETVIAGNDLTYTVTVKNSGPSDAHNVVTTDVLPAGVIFVSASSPCTEAGGTITCNETSIADGSSVAYTITVTVPSSTADGASLTNKVETSSDSYDPDTSNNGDDTETEVVRSANLTIDKTVSATTANAGTSVTYTITVDNDGPSNAANVVVTDTVPTGMTATSATTTIGTCTTTGSTVSCSHPDLAPTDTMTITVVVDIDPSVAGGTTLTNDAETSTTTTETNSDDNTDTVDVEVLAVADLGVTKTSDVSTVIAGESLTYTITATNAGPSDAQNVVISDTVPANLTISSVTPAADCSIVGNVITCTTSTVAYDDDYVVTIATTVSEDAGDGSTISNTASVASDTTDDNPDDNSATDETEVEKSVDLELSKTSAAERVAAGETLLYNLEISNLGPSSATNVVVTDILPSGVTFNSTMSNSNCTETGGVGTCSFPTIASDATVAFVIAVDLPTDFTDGATLSNSASVEANENDPNEDNNSDTDEITVDNQADLSIVKNAEGSVVAGESISWTIDIANAGPSDAVNVVITDTLPLGATFNTASSDGRCSAAGQTVTCTIAAMAADSTDSFVIDVDVASSVADMATLSNGAEIASDTDDPNLDDNTSSDDVPVSRESDLTIVKTDLADPVVAGGQIQWSIAVTNNGPSDADNVTITDALPTGFSFVSVDDATNCSAPANTVNCLFPTVTNGSTVTVVITADIDSDLADGSIHTNTATAASDSSEPVSATEDTSVQRESDLGITKTSDGAVVAGTNQTYTIEVTNNGPSDAANVVVTDALPAGISFVSDSLSACSAAGAVVTCNLATLADQAVLSFDLIVAVSDDATNPTVNVVKANSDSTDPTTDNNTADDSTDITFEADLSMTKSAEPDPATPGEEITWTLVVTNSGPSIANNVVVTDILPSGTTFASASTGCSHTAGTVTCSAVSILSGAQATFTITAALDSSLTGSVTNTASVDSDTPDPNPDDNSATDETPLTPSADLSVLKESSADPVTAGEQMTYTIVVSNSGPSDAANIVVTDVLPAGLTVVAADPSGDCSVAGQSVTCSTSSLAVNADYVVTLVADLNEETAQGSTITNTASVSSDTPDPDPDNDSSTEETSVAKSADLEITKAVGVTTVSAGQQLIYGVTLANNGPSSATNIVITDTLPAGVVYNSAQSSASCAEASGVVTCTSPVLNSDQTIVFNIVVDLPSSLLDASTLVNQIAVTADESDPSPDNNEDTDEITLTNLADLSIVKDTDGFVVAGQSIAWDLNVFNSGHSDAVNVVISDTLPAGTTFDPVASDPRCSAASAIVTCNLGTVAADTADVVVISVNADSSLPDLGSIANTASISSDTEDPDPEDNSSTDSVPIERDSGLSIAKTDLSDPVVAGQQVQWSILVSNAGPSDADNVAVTDSAPPGFTVVTVDNNVNCAIAGNTVNCAFPVIASGDNIEIVVTADVDSELADGSNHVNTATATSDSSETVEDSEDTTSVRSSDLSISKTSDRAVVAGTQHQYEITVSNQGPSDADNVVITDILPTGVTYVSDTVGAELSGATCSPVLGTVVCDMGTVANNQTVTFTLVVAVADAAGDVAANVVTIDSDSSDPNPDNNTGSDDTTVSFEADLAVTKTASPDPAIPGQPITWELTVANSGPSIANNVVLTDVLPTGTSIVSATVGCSEASGVVTCSADALAAGEQLSFEIVADIDANHVDAIINTAKATSDTPDSNPGDNEATATTETGASADLSLTKSVLTNPVVAGQEAVFELTVANAGPSDALDVIVTDELPPGFTFVWADDGCTLSDNAAGAGSSNGTVDCVLPMLASGATHSIQLAVTVDSTITEGDIVTNTASVTAATPDADPTSNEGTVDVPVTQQAELEVTKTVLTDDPKIGDVVEWLVEVSNVGPSQATNVMALDQIDPSFTNVQTDSTDCVVVSNDVSCSLATLASGAQWSTTISAIATNDAAGDRVNVVQVTSDSTDFVSGSALYNIRIPELDLSLTKISSDIVRSVGDMVEWLIVVENNGEPTASPALISDEVEATQQVVTVTSSDATCTNQANEIECTIPAGFTGQAEIAVTTEVLDVSGEITNSAVLTVENGPTSETEQTVGSADIERDEDPVGPLAFTGSRSIATGLFATALLLIGFALVRTGRRRLLTG